MADGKQSLLGRFAPHLPYLRRFARSLLESQDLGDAEVRNLLEDIAKGNIAVEGRENVRVSLYEAFLKRINKRYESIPLWRQAFFLTSFEGFDFVQAAKILKLREDAVRRLVAEAQVEVGSSIKGKILIVEDEEIIARDLAGIVSGAGHSVTGIASTYDEAVELFKKERPDLILVDVMLSDGSSGIDLIRELNKREKTGSIFITAFPERLLTGERPEPTFLITKPYQPETVVAAVSQYMFLQNQDNIESQKLEISPNEKSNSLKRKLRSVQQDPLGAKFLYESEHLVIDGSGDSSDEGALRQPEIRQLAVQIRIRTEAFLEVAQHLDKQHGWEGIASTVNRFSQAISVPIEDIPGNIGTIWSEAVELGSFLELDAAVRRERPHTNMHPLDMDAHRRLASLVRVVAPWVRQFPTARRLDDETGSFLAKSELFEAADSVIRSSTAEALIAPDDRAILVGLADAARRGEFQGAKAKTRSIASARNLVIGALLVSAGVYGDAVKSEFGDRSRLAKTAGAFLAETVEPLEDLLLDSMPDVRAALEEAREEFLELGRELSDNDQISFEMDDENRTWLQEVEAIIQSFGLREFSLSELYDHEHRLSILHPENRNIRAKIRQQLQRLRDIGVLDFVSRGRYRRRAAT